MSTPPLLPPALRPGDRAVIVSPSSTIADQQPAALKARDAFAQALDLHVDFAEHAFATHHYSAGTPDQRASDLMAAFTDPAVKAVLLSMGGATAIDVLDLLDYDAIAANPKIVAGISDSTTILQAITTRTGLVTFHGLELLDFARHPMTYTLDAARSTWFNAWSGPWQPNPDWRDLDGEATTYRGWRTIKPGIASGPVVGGNSDAFTQLIATPYAPRFDGAILAVETYRLHKRHIHALLVSLRLRGVLDAVNGMLIGYCLGSDAPGTGNDRDIADIVVETTAGYDIPVIQIGEIGHQVENLLLPLGAQVHLNTDTPSLALDSPVVTTV
jgi:muramoyltetrapeptide carboxypeptidase